MTHLYRIFPAIGAGHIISVMADDPEQAMERAGANGWAGPQLTSTAYAERVEDGMEFEEGME